MGSLPDFLPVLLFGKGLFMVYNGRGRKSDNMEKNEVVIATHNPGKVAEFKRMLEPLGFTVSSIADLGMKIEAEETGTTFEENSLIKAHDVGDRLKDRIVIADDSGLEIHALGGFPGIHSARFMEGSPYTEKMKALQEMLKGKADRSANYTAAISLVNFDGEDHVFVGKTEGIILDSILGGHGFGYDPFFYSTELKKTFGQATAEEKDSVSHRSKALKACEDYIKAHLD